MVESEPHYVFLPYVATFGGIERLLLMLARHPAFGAKPLTLLCFGCQVDFAKLSEGRLRVESIPCARKTGSEILALRTYMSQHAILPRQLLVMEIIGAFYAAFCLPAGFAMHIADPPGLLPSDRSKASFSIAKTQDYATPAGPAGRVAGEVRHQIVRRGCQKAHTVLTMTQRNKRELDEIYGVNAGVVYPGIELDGVTRASRPKSACARFLSVCRLEPSKHLDHLIDAFARLMAEGKIQPGDWALEFVGDGSQREALETRVADHGLCGNVVFRGFVSDAELEQSFAAAHVFLMPAKQGYGLPGMEALARGMSLVVHVESGVSELYADEPWVHLINDLNGDLQGAIAKSIGQVQRGELVNAAAPRVIDGQDWAGQVITACGWA